MPNSANFLPQDCFDLSAVIGSGQATSQEIDLGGTTLCGVIMPAAFTGTSISLQTTTASGGAYVTVQDGSGNDFSLGVTLSRYIPINNLAVTAGLRFVKLVSNASEGTARSIQLVTRSI